MKKSRKAPSSIRKTIARNKLALALVKPPDIPNEKKGGRANKTYQREWNEYQLRLTAQIQAQLAIAREFLTKPTIIPFSERMTEVEFKCLQWMKLETLCEFGATVTCEHPEPVPPDTYAMKVYVATFGDLRWESIAHWSGSPALLKGFNPQPTQPNEAPEKSKG